MINSPWRPTMMQITRAEIIAVTLFIATPQTDFTLNLTTSHETFPLLPPAYVQRRSWSHAPLISPWLFCEEASMFWNCQHPRCRRTVKSAARCFRYIDFDVRVNLSATVARSLFRRALHSASVYVYREWCLFLYARDIQSIHQLCFVRIMSHTFQTIVTTWASDYTDAIAIAPPPIAAATAFRNVEALSTSRSLALIFFNLEIKFVRYVSRPNTRLPSTPIAAHVRAWLYLAAVKTSTRHYLLSAIGDTRC